MPYKPVQLLEQHGRQCEDQYLPILKNPHECWTLEELKYGFMFPEEKRIKRDLTGRNNGRASHSWVQFRCNYPDCPAKLIMYYPYFESRLGFSGVLPSPLFPIPTELPPPEKRTRY